jgi:hypothetical protein
VEGAVAELATEAPAFPAGCGIRFYPRRRGKRASASTSWNCGGKYKSLSGPFGTNIGNFEGRISVVKIPMQYHFGKRKRKLRFL